MKKVIFILFMCTIFSCKDSMEDVPTAYQVFPPEWLLGYWETTDNSTEIDAFGFTRVGMTSFRNGVEEYFGVMVMSNPSLPDKDFDQVETSTMFKIIQKMEGGEEKIWYEFRKVSDSEFELVGQGNYQYKHGW